MTKHFLLFALGLMMTLGVQQVQATPIATDNWYHYDSGVTSGNMVRAHKWGIMFPAGTVPESEQLTQIAIYESKTHNTSEFTLTIYSGGDTPAEGTQIHQQTFAPMGADGWHIVPINSPLYFDESQNHWIIFEEQGVLYPASYSTDTEDADPNGRWHYGNNGWETSTYLSSNEAYMIRALFGEEVECATPIGVNVRSIKTNSATIEWDRMDAASEWTVAYKKAGTPVWHYSDVLTTKSFEITDLEPGTEYLVEVCAVCGEDSYSDWSNTKSFTTLSEPQSITIEENGWAHYDNGTFSASIGTGGTGSDLFYWGIRIPAGSVTSSYLDKVKLVCENSGELTLHIYEGGETPSRGELKHSQDVQVAGSEDFQEFFLNPSLAIDPNKDLWIVFKNDKGVSHPAGFSESHNAPDARWISIDGNQWSDIKEIESSYNNIAWMIRAHFEESTGIEEIVESRESRVESRKMLHDGQLYLLRDGKIFNAQGARIK